MENDSLIVDSLADEVTVADSTVVDSVVAPEMQLPTPEQLGINIASGPAGGMPALTVGDTFEFPITVSWNVQGSALLVVPTSSANAKGLTQLEMSQESARSVKDGAEVASITFTYKIVAQDTGNLNIPALRFEIPTQMGRPLDLRSESVPVRVNEPFNPLPLGVGLLVALCVLFAGLWRVKRRAAVRETLNAQKEAENALREQMLVLKQRVNSADSREWILELEEICKEYAAEKFGLTVASVNLENLQKDGKLKGWQSLLDEFAHARYGGGKRDGFENRETWKGAMRLMGISEEE